MAKTPALPFAHRPPEITILSDHATQDRSFDDLGKSDVEHIADRDLLALESRLSSTFDILRHKNTRCPLAVAVYGDWVTGKTSAMRWLETKLKDWNSSDKATREGHPRAYPVWFDPWRYHSREEVWRGIIAEVILALFRVGQLDRENILPRMVQAVKKFGGFLGRSFIHAVANLEMEAGGKAKVPGLAEGEMKFSAKGEMFRDIWEEYEKAAQPHKAHLNQFEDTLRSWVESFLSEDKSLKREQARIVLFIDDLDRCMPDVALEVLEALKLYLNIPHLIFVVGLDREVVQSVVTKHYDNHGVKATKAASYLDKLFQLELRIPPSEAQMGRFMEEQLVALNKATSGYWQRTLDLTDHKATLEQSLIRLAQHNPREVKRLLNSALILGRSAALDEKLKHENENEKDTALRFAQGIQVLLLQRVLGEDLVNRVKVFTIGRHLQWLERASRLVCDFLTKSNWDIEELSFQLRQVGPEISEETGELQDHNQRLPNGVKTSDPAVRNAFIKLLRCFIENPPDRESQLWIHPAFLELMRVPFSQAVAQNAPVIAPAVQSATATADGLAAIPSFMRERLASAANVLPGELTPNHLTTISELNLSGTHLTANDLRQLPRLDVLEKLDLTNCHMLEGTNELAGLTGLRTLYLQYCTRLQGSGAFAGLSELQDLQILALTGCIGLVDTSALAGLTELKALYLDNCTGLKGIEALEGLKGLRKLRELDLSGCTGLTKEDVAVLQQALGESCKIFGS